MEYDRFILAPPIQNATLRNWPGVNVKGRNGSLDEGSRRKVFTPGVSMTMLPTRSWPRQFAVIGEAVASSGTGVGNLSTGGGPGRGQRSTGQRR